jgi:hypothetical protein
MAGLQKNSEVRMADKTLKTWASLPGRGTHEGCPYQALRGTDRPGRITQKVGGWAMRCAFPSGAAAKLSDCGNKEAVSKLREWKVEC